ncbi:Ubiquitin-associated domain-containing protein 2 [Glycine soja]|uniref:Ubiquitin-associated domain-containing protein 2 n=1 Tax=Glycine soja TaxID=3848 RepID=A0A0B2PI78_GLYSO|nr:Ubiquitin-associated domain-containing protein 2 [Glycine soja]
MNGGPSGFTNAPVTRAFIITSALFTIFFGIQGRFSTLGLSYQDIFGKLRLWKLIISIFSFSSTPELMFGLYLLYYFRVFERQIGSNKYSVFIVFSILTSLLLEVLAVALLKDPTANLVTPGPYGLIFASFLPFFFDIPVSTRFRVFSFLFSDKSFIYLAGLQLLLSSWKRSILPGMCGILAGSLYRLNVFYIRKAKRNYPAPMQAAVEPTEDSITTLVSMGFDRNSARQALVQARNDVNVATNILLEAQSH